MYSLIYISTAAYPMSDEDLVEILAKSRENNVPRGITGLLLYKEGRFLQVLEGPEEEVIHLYETIRQDERHYDVTTVLEGHITQREFADWAMGFSNIDEVVSPDVQGVSMFMKGEYMPEMVTDMSQVQAMLQVFRGIARGA